MALPGDREWRGLIVDGETVTLDLAGHTLALGDAGLSQKTYSVRVGEGRSAPSALTLRGGTVVASNNVLVGGVHGAAGDGATLTLDGGAVLDLKSGVGLASVSVADAGPGALVVRGGSRLATNLLALSRKGPAEGETALLRSTLEVSGAGSRIEATSVNLADRGDTTATVKEGGVLQTQALQMAQFAGAKATLTVDGPGSQLVLTGGLVSVGAGGRATLQVQNGAALLGNDSLITVGSGQPSDFSVLRVTGRDTVLSEVGVNVQAGGHFELRDAAQWTGPAGGLTVHGGTARIETAQARLVALSVAGVYEGQNLVSSGQLTLANGARVDATGASITVGSGGQLTLMGTGTQLTGFSELMVNGQMTVNSGSLLEGDTVGLANDASLQGTGTIKVNHTFTAAGQLKPGNSPGLLRIEGNVVLTDTAELVLEVAGSEAGLSHDVLQVTGSLTLQGGHITLAFIDGYAPTAGQQFNLLDIAGSFISTAQVSVTGLQPGWVFSTGFDATTGRYTVQSLSDGVSAVPEPSTWLLMGAGVLALVRAARRR